jgi:uncharacterized membrane protein YraQ (UPF0718 family)
MKVVDNNIFKDLSKVCLDIAKYVVTGTILAPFFSGFEKNSTIMYLVGAGLFIVVLLLYWTFYMLSKKKE